VLSSSLRAFAFCHAPLRRPNVNTCFQIGITGSRPSAGKRKYNRGRAVQHFQLEVVVGGRRRDRMPERQMQAQKIVLDLAIRGFDLCRVAR